jgi:uncharacterized protein
MPMASTTSCGRRSFVVLDARGQTLAVAFARKVRCAGLAVPVGSTVLVAQALEHVGIDREPSVYWAGRATLVKRPEDIPAYDAAFAAFWRGVTRASGEAAPVRQNVVRALNEIDVSGEAPVDGDEADGMPIATVRYSTRETLRHKDFADCSPAELEESRRMMADLRLAGAMRRSRRLRPTKRRRSGSGARPDLRRTVQRSLRAGGEVAALDRKAPGTRRRRLVLLVDISGSMDPYARALLRFAHAAVNGRRQVEVFSLGTRLTRLTRELAIHDPDQALDRAAVAAVDWSGGTRLGEGLRAFNDRWGVRGLARGAVVVVLSDGWDRGDPDELAEQLARVQRVAHRVVWVNPLKASPGYAPLARGMAAALPYLDEFVEGHSLASIERLAELLDA